MSNRGQNTKTGSKKHDTHQGITSLSKDKLETKKP